MKHIDYLYFNIYSYFYRISLYKRSLNHRMQTMYLFSLGSGGWLLLLESIYLRFIKHTRFASPGESAVFSSSLYFLTAAFYYYIFILRDRDLMIFGKYQELSDKNPNGKRDFIISLTVLAFPYAVLMAFAVIFPRHSQ